MGHVLGKVRGLLALLLVGPALLCLTFLVHAGYAASFVAVAFLALAIRFGARGIFWGVLITIGYSVFAVTVADKALLSAVWHASFLLSLIITALSFEEGADRFSREDEYRVELEEKMEEMETSAQSDKQSILEELIDMQKELKGARSETEALRNLENTAGIEADKFAEQNRALIAESLEHHRKIVYLEQSVQGFTEELGRLRELEAVSKKRVDELNALRMENYQLKQLEKPQPEPVVESDSQVATLEKNKTEVKASYDAMLAEYNTLKKSLEKLVAQQNRTAEEEAIYQQQRKVFEKKKVALNQLRLELIQVERELFILKKTLTNSNR